MLFGNRQPAETWQLFSNIGIPKTLMNCVPFKREQSGLLQQELAGDISCFAGVYDAAGGIAKMAVRQSTCRLEMPLQQMIIPGMPAYVAAGGEAKDAAGFVADTQG